MISEMPETFQATSNMIKITTIPDVERIFSHPKISFQNYIKNS